MAKKEDVVVIQGIKEVRVPIRIVGITPLIVHSWSEKAKKEMLDKQMKKTVTEARKAKDPFDDFVQSLYWLTEKPEESTPDAFEEAVKNGAKFGFKVGAIKMAANSAAYRSGWVKNQMGLRGAYFLESEYGEFFEIKDVNTGKPCIPQMREDSVKVGMGTADLRYRGEFVNWYADLMLSYDESGEFTIEQLMNCINKGGYSVGIGEWRPEKDGEFGRYRVVAR